MDSTARISSVRNQATGHRSGFSGGGPDREEPILRVWRLRGPANATPNRTLLGSVPSPTLLSGDFSSLSTAIKDPLTGLPFPGNIIPSSRFSKFAKTLGPTVPAPNNPGVEQLQSGQAVQRRRRYRGRAARSGNHQEAQPLRAFPVLQRQSAESRRSSATRTFRRPAGTWPSARPGSSRRRSSTRHGSATTTRTT